MHMMQWKRWSVVGVALLLFAAALAACGDNKDEKATPTSPGATEPGVTAPTATETAATEPTEASGAGATIDVSAANIAFAPETIDAPASESFTVQFDNQDDGLPHSFAIFASEDDAQSGADPLAATETITGPDTTEVTVPALEPGEYFVWCQVHTSAMTATLVVQSG